MAGDGKWVGPWTSVACEASYVANVPDGRVLRAPMMLPAAGACTYTALCTLKCFFGSTGRAPLSPPSLPNACAQWPGVLSTRGSCIYCCLPYIHTCPPMRIDRYSTRTHADTGTIYVSEWSMVVWCADKAVRTRRMVFPPAAHAHFSSACQLTHRIRAYVCACAYLFPHEYVFFVATGRGIHLPTGHQQPQQQQLSRQSVSTFYI